MAVVRRFILKPSRLDSKPDDHLKYLWVFVILLTGYLIKGYRLALVGGALPTDSFSWAPISSTLSRFMLVLPSEALNELLFWHRVLIHAIPAIAFFGYMVFSRSSLEHIYLSALNVFYRSLISKRQKVMVSRRSRNLPGNNFSISRPAPDAGDVKTTVRLI
jgi:nitrate reductase gamma subunit